MASYGGEDNRTEPDTWGLSILGLAPAYIGVICLIVLGAGVMSAVSRARTKDLSR